MTWAGRDHPSAPGRLRRICYMPSVEFFRICDLSTPFPAWRMRAYANVRDVHIYWALPFALQAHSSHALRILSNGSASARR